MYQFYFEKLEVWQNARGLVKSVYSVSRFFPKAEQFGITSQIRRSSMSIASNISEGVSRYTKKDKARFMVLAFGSAMETINHLILAKDLEYLSEQEYINLRKDLQLITNQLNALHKSLT
ncbi:four helix bundle protein [Robertkochia flava]|uniref:four helix bundle protein n=1 Tax=Robertkochia flava TaxID=3447986 RepID=UPI001CCF728D|nr:four helix bundle protein [Robertkochia marina]